MLGLYARLGWSLVSGDMGFNPSTGKKTFRFHSDSWKTDPVCEPDATGYALLTGDVSGVMAIDLDDPTLSHNAKLAQMCEEAGGIKQITRKGCHYIFRSDERLRTTTNTKLALDIRNKNALLYVEPSQYNIDGRTQFYKFQNIPTDADHIPECPDEIVEYIHSLFKPNIEKADAKKIRDTTKRENAGMDKLRVEMNKSEEDVRILLGAINVEHATNYHDWIKVGMALHHEGFGWELWDEFSRRSPDYKEGEPFYVWDSLTKHKVTDEPVSMRTLYWWCKQENDAVFKELVNREVNKEYETMKEEFEKNTFVVGSRIVRVQENGSHAFMCDRDAQVMFANRQFRKWDEGKMVKQNFYAWWLRDEKRKSFERMDFIPPPMVCPPSVYNLYKGFVAEKMDEVPDADIEKLIDPILTHIHLLTSGHSNLFLHWLANILQSPSVKSEIAIVFRDESQFLKAGGGTGKNIFLEWFASKLLGDEYFAIVSNNSELYNPFNEHLEHKLLVFVEEARGRDNSKEIDSLKSAITCKTKTINRKGVPKYTQNDFARYVFATNHANPIAGYGATPGDRRFWFVDVDQSMRNNSGYFNDLVKCMSDPRVVRAFYQYLMNFKVYKTPIEFQKNRPITDAFIDIRRMNAEPILRWVIDRIEKNEPLRGESSELFADFKEWMMRRNEQKGEDFHISLTKFVQYLTKNNELTRVPEGGAGKDEKGLYKSSTSHIQLDSDRIRKELMKNLYIKPSAALMFSDEDATE